MKRKGFISVMVYVAFSMVQIADALDLPPDVRDFLLKADVMDDGYRSVPPTESGHAFRLYATKNWQAVLDNFHSVAPNANQQRLIFSALEDLPGRTYLEALNKICDLQEQNVISAQTLEYVFTGARLNFISNNYRDPQVVMLLERLQKQLSQSSRVQQWIGDVLSGKQRSTDLEAASETGNPPPETLAPR